MAKHNNSLWQTVVFLFISKFDPQAGQPFEQKLLINAKNVELARRFAAMVGDTTEDTKIKLALLKGLQQLEKTDYIQRIDDATLQLTSTGYAQMKQEIQTAMKKIAENFPENKPKDKPAPVMQ